MTQNPMIGIEPEQADVNIKIELTGKGDPGYTPQRGVDYWTEEDKQEIVDDVKQEIGELPGGGTVRSVNGKSPDKNGDVVVDPELPSAWDIPSSDPSDPMPYDKVLGTEFGGDGEPKWVLQSPPSAEAVRYTAQTLNVNQQAQARKNIGAQPAGDYALKSEIPSAAVQSVNGKTGDVVLTADDVGAAKKEDVERLSEEIGDIVVGTNSEGGSKSRNLLYMSDTEHHTINGLEFWFEGNTIHLNGLATTGSSESDDVRLKLTGVPEYICNWKNPDAWMTETVTIVERGKTYYAYSELISGSATADPEGGSGAVLSVRDSTGASKISEAKSPYTYAEGDARLAYAVFFVPCNVTYTDAVYVFALTEGAEKVPYDELGEETQTGRKLKRDIEVPAASVIGVDEAGELSELLFCKVPSKYSVTKIKDDVFETMAAVQGMCSDGTYLYYSVVKSDDVNTVLCKYRLADGTIVATAENHSYGHANGLAYLPDRNELLICHMDEIGTVSRVNADTLAFIESFALNDVLSTVVPWWVGVGAVAYDVTRDKIIYLLRGVEEEDGRTSKGFAVFDGQMRFEKIIKTEYIESDTYSGLATDEQYIYLSVSNPSTTVRGERLIAYDWHGNVVNNIALSGMAHFEAQAWVGNTLYTVSAEKKDSQNYNCASIFKCVPVAHEKVSKLDLLMRYSLNY